MSILRRLYERIVGTDNNSYNSPQGIMVGMDQIKSSSRPLVTGGLSICSALGFSYSGLNFLGHISPMTPIGELIKKISEFPQIREIHEDPNFRVYLWEGEFNSQTPCTDIIKGALRQTGLLERVAYQGTVNPLDIVGINQDGPFIVKDS